MAMLSLEVNRLLGSALLDPDFLRRVFSAERAVALQSFGLSSQERSAILASQARTLKDLSRELMAKLATADMADADAGVGVLMQALPARNAPPMDVHTYVQRAVDVIASRMAPVAPDAQYEELYLQKIAS